MRFYCWGLLAEVGGKWQTVANHAAEVKLRAERKAGELLQQLERAPEGRPQKLDQPGIVSEYRAVLTDSDIAPHFRTWDGTGSLVSLVVSLNLHRRHLTSGQKAIIGAEILPMLEDEAKERQGARTDLTLLNSLSNVATERNDSTAAAQAANDID